ncbi:Tar ligand binding domain-containing protein, partial [Yersinia intermedia]
MFGRIRISTSFFLLLILICSIQLISSGLSFTASRPETFDKLFMASVRA